MRPAQVVADIVDAGGAVWVEAGRLMARRVPPHLIPHIREHKATLLVLLSPQTFVTPLPSEQRADDYAVTERQAIQAESMESTTAPAPMPYRANLAPQRVSCGVCSRFQPGPQPLSIGRCLATVDGLPPKGGSGYKAAFPMAQRHCPEFSGVQP